MNYRFSLAAVGGLMDRLPRWIAPAATPIVLAVRYFPSYEAGIVNRLWSPTGSLYEGRFVLVDPETGYQANILRGGICCACWFWQHLIRTPLFPPE